MYHARSFARLKKVKKVLFLLAFVLLFLVYPRPSFAASCPSSNISCQESCDSPCVRVVTQPGGPAGRSAPAQPVCACQMPNAAGSVREGGRCQGPSDCASGLYCWGSRLSGLPTCHSSPASSASQQPAQYQVCDFLPSDKQRDCNRCFQGGEAWTAIGCIPTDPSGFLAKFLGLGVGIAGGIAFLLILLGGFQMITSTGNPEKLNAGKELVTSAISGLVLIIFSLFLLRLIGFNILGIPGFG